MKRFMTGSTLCFLLFLGLIFTGVCFAVDTIPAHATPEAASPFVAFLQQSVFPILTALFMGVLTLFLKVLGKKFGVDYLTKENNLLEQLAYQGITKAEEVAAQFAGSKKALTGDDKLSVAVRHILSVMPKVGEAQAESVVHSLLAQIPGVGATGATSFVPGGSALASLAAPAADTPDAAAAATA